MSRRHQSVENGVQETLRLGTATAKAALTSLRNHLSRLDKRIAIPDGDLGKRLCVPDARETKDDLLRGIPGLGVVTTLSIAAKCRNLGQLDRHQIAKLVGVAPLANESG